MLRTLLDFFCSRPFADPESLKTRLLVIINAALWIVVATIVGATCAGDYAVLGEHAHDVALFVGALPGSHEPYPLLWTLKALFLGATPSIYAMHIFGSVIMGLLCAFTFRLVYFWVTDAADDDSVVRKRPLTALLTANLTCALLLTSLPGLYLTTGFTTVTWAFMWVPLCAWLQSRYAANGGTRLDMLIFGLVLGIAAIESPWVLALLPIFFLRTIAFEWRLWDHNVRNLAIWFIAVVVGGVLMLSFNAIRITGEWSIPAVTKTEIAVLRTHLTILRGLISMQWILDLVAGIGWATMAWITARRLLNNDRNWGLLLTALTMSGASILLLWMVDRSPMRVWMWIGQLPVATLWITCVASAMLIAGWGTQLFAKNPNIYEELDRHHIPAHVTALRVAAILIFPVSLIAAISANVYHGCHFAQTDRELSSRFAQSIIDTIKPDSGKRAAAHPYLFGEYWIDTQLLLAAYRTQTPLTLLSLNMSGSAAYIEYLKQQLSSDPLLESADRLRLLHLVEYSFPVFIQDFFASQTNVNDIAAVLSRPNVWHAGRLHPMAYGPIYLGMKDPMTKVEDAVSEMDAFTKQWACVQDDEAVKQWWNVSAQTAKHIRHHLAFMNNNLGTWLDDQGELDAAAEHYLAASKIEPENVSALLNLYDICVRRGALADRRVEIQKAFEDLISNRMKNPVKYNLTGVGQYFGYIRNYGLFVQMGLEWAADAAPESILAGLRNVQTGLAPNDPRSAALHAITAAVYEMQGQADRSVAGYLAAVSADPKNVEAMRGLARLAIQDGNVTEAGQWISKAEAAGADDNMMNLDRGAYLMARGDYEGANKVISAFTTKNPDSVVGWSMLGMLRVEQGNLEDAGGFILETIRRKARNKDMYFYHTLLGRIAQEEATRCEQAAVAAETDGKKSIAQTKLSDAHLKWEEARKQYSRAYAIRPNVRGILEIMLNIDRRLEDKKEAEATALAILRSTPTHGYANFIVGSQRLEDGHITAAISYLKAAVEGNAEPTVDLINNYADALTRTADLALAKDMAVRAVRLAPRSYATWGTLALALARNKDNANAQSALAKARGLPGGVDPHLHFVDFWLAVNKRDKAAAANAIQAFKQETASETLIPLDQRDLQEAETILQTL